MMYGKMEKNVIGEALITKSTADHKHDKDTERTKE